MSVKGSIEYFWNLREDVEGDSRPSRSCDDHPSYCADLALNEHYVYLKLKKLFARRFGHNFNAKFDAISDCLKKLISRYQIFWKT